MAHMVKTPGSILAGRPVLVTGHTGFAGSWLVLWLSALGVDVHGLALAPPRDGLFHGADLAPLMATCHIGDVRDAEFVQRVVTACRPHLVIHLAAQATVPESYSEPLTTFDTNVMGTAHVLEAARRVPEVQACVVVTSDKCYLPADAAHTEEDPLGGNDPYSASKAAAEIVAAAFGRSYPDGPGIATARAGNIIGGGDHTVGRIVPDFVAAATAGRPLALRRPEAVRPWQSVLDCLAGYLLLAERLLRDRSTVAGAWNFGPDVGETLTVGDLVSTLERAWQALGGWPLPAPVRARTRYRETGVLLLDSNHARRDLDWRPALSAEAAAGNSVAWYWHAAHDPHFDARSFSLGQLHEYWARSASLSAAEVLA